MRGHYHNAGVMDAATSSYRRANGSQATTVKPRREPAGKVQPRAHTPSPEARKRANAERRGMI